jgi:hypothetical protein
MGFRVPVFTHICETLICIALLFAGPPASGADGVVNHLSGEELAAILKDEGYVPRLEEPRVLSAKIEGMKTMFFIADDSESIQAYAGFAAAKATLEQVNVWNQTHRYSRAYIDAEGDPVIELDLDLAGGVTRERIIDFARTAALAIPAFAKQFGAGD